MGKQLLIYEKVIPISKERHLDWSVKSGKDYSFSNNVNSLPLMAVEFLNAASEYTIVFVGNQETGNIVPAAIVGLGNENLYLTEAGDWKASYIPAFVRRYPFVFAGNQAGDTLTLCIDEDFEGCNQEGRGERLFDAEGEQTQYLKGTLEFLQEYQAQFQRTQLFCKRLSEFGLLEPMQASLSLPSGQKTTLDGFMGINREKLKELTGEQLSQLNALDELELIYLHLQSVRRFADMADLIPEDFEILDTDSASSKEEVLAEV